MLVKYARNKNGQAVGCIVAVKLEDNVSIGWSLCNKKDKYDKELGRKIAFNRAEGQSKDNSLQISLDKVYLVPNKPIPHLLNMEVAIMADRAERYFKLV